ncbi:MAG: hypothetical protein AAF830_13990 [Pseudomonadota bacterium]
MFHFIAEDRRAEGPVAAHHASAHPVHGLLGILLALVLGDRREQVFNEDRVAIFAELNGRAFNLRACSVDRMFKLQVRFDVPRDAADVIDQHNVYGALAGFLEVAEHRGDAWTIDEPAGDSTIGEHLGHLIPFHARKLAAAGFLGSETVALRRLRR